MFDWIKKHFTKAVAVLSAVKAWVGTLYHTRSLSSANNSYRNKLMGSQALVYEGEEPRVVGPTLGRGFSIDTGTHKPHNSFQKKIKQEQQRRTIGSQHGDL